MALRNPSDILGIGTGQQATRSNMSGGHGPSKEAFLRTVGFRPCGRSRAARGPKGRTTVRELRTSLGSGAQCLQTETCANLAVRYAFGLQSSFELSRAALHNAQLDASATGAGPAAPLAAAAAAAGVVPAGFSSEMSSIGSFGYSLRICAGRDASARLTNTRAGTRTRETSAGSANRDTSS
jgi:hypothetical protein